MSLIHDALRKARKEAAERDAEERGSTYVPPRAHRPESSPSWIPGLVVGLVVGIGVAFLLFLALRAPVAGPTDEPAAAASEERATEPVVEPESLDVAPAPAPPPIQPDDVESVDPETSPRGAESPPVSPADDGTEGESEEEAEDETPVEREANDAADADVNPAPDLPDARPTELEPDAPRLVEPPETVGPVGAPEDRTFVLEAEVDGVRLELDFIVWSTREPFAQVNRRQVTVGQTVDGFVVRRIERERVVLEGEGGLVTIRVR